MSDLTPLVQYASDQYIVSDNLRILSEAPSPKCCSKHWHFFLAIILQKAIFLSNTHVSFFAIFLVKIYRYVWSDPFSMLTINIQFRRIWFTNSCSVVMLALFLICSKSCMTCVYFPSQKRPIPHPTYIIFVDFGVILKSF